MGWGIGGGGQKTCKRGQQLAAAWFRRSIQPKLPFFIAFFLVSRPPCMVGPGKVIKLAAARVIPRRILTVSLDGRIVGQDGWRIPPAALYYTFWAKRPADMGDGRPRLS